MRAALAAGLQRVTGRMVVTAATLEDALAHIARERPQVVLCDPTTLAARRTAAEVVRRLVATEVPVLVLVPSTAAGEDAAWHEAGARQVLLKGVSLSALLQVITTVVTEAP